MIRRFPDHFIPHEIPPGCHPVVRRLFEEMNQRRMTMKEVASKSGVPVPTISQWRRLHNPHLVNIEAALNTVGLRIRIE